MIVNKALQSIHVLKCKDKKNIKRSRLIIMTRTKRIKSYCVVQLHRTSQSVRRGVPRRRLCDHLHIPQLRLLGALLNLLWLRLQLHLLWNVCVV